MKKSLFYCSFLFTLVVAVSIPNNILAQGRDTVNYKKGFLYLSIIDMAASPNGNYSQDTTVLTDNSQINAIFESFKVRSLEKSFPSNNDATLERVYTLYCECNEYDLMNTLSPVTNLFQYVERTPKFYSDYVPNDYTSSDNDPPGVPLWHLEKMNAVDAWDLTNNIPFDRTIAIVELMGNNNWVQTNHPDLAGNIVFYEEDGFTSTGGLHGTRVAGCAAAVTDNNNGISSIGGMNCKLKIYMTNNFVPKMVEASDNGAHIISMSLSGLSFSITDQAAMNYIHNNGTVIVTSAGNTDCDPNVVTCDSYCINPPLCNGINDCVNCSPPPCKYPACYDNVIAVSATDENDEKTWFSSYYDPVDISAPGLNIWTTSQGSTYSYFGGTSAATPIVAGVCGLILSVNPCLTPDDVEFILKASSVNIDGLNPDHVGKLGAGRVDAYAAVVMAQNFPPTIQSTLTFDVNASCLNVCNGSADLTVSGNDPFSYLWSNGSTSEDVSGLCVGTYDVTVTDNNECATVGSISVPEFPYLGPDRTVCVLTDQLDAGFMPGASYAWTFNGSSTGGNTQTIATTQSGEYCVTVTGGPCPGTDCTNLIFVDPVSVSIGLPFPISSICAGEEVCFSGAVNILSLPGGGGGGNVNTSYFWSFGIGASPTTSTDQIGCTSFSTPGSYGIVFVYTNECGSFSATKNISVLPSNPPVLSITSTNSSCNGAIDGTATVTATGGVPPFTYQWDDILEQTTPTAANLTGVFSTGAVYNVTVTGANGCSSTANATVFEPIQGCGICGGTVEIVPFGSDPNSPCAPAKIGSPCPGFDYGYQLTYRSNGNLPAGSLLKLKIDPTMKFGSTIQTVPALTEISIDQQNRHWVVPGGTDFLVWVAVEIIGIPQPDGIWTTLGSIERNCFGPTVEVGAFLQEGPDQCSCDPNDKMLVSPEGCGQQGFINNQELTYTVRFQNLGTGPAHDVVIIDTLDLDLDTNTFQIVTSLHTITNVEIVPPNILVISFIGIELPAEVNDLLGSNGMVMYDITPFSGLPQGTEIDNSAAIIFDNNVPVITNTVMNTILLDTTIAVDAGPDDTVYVGYSPEECATLSATVIGSSLGSSFLWSTGDTTQSITVCPTATTAYTVSVDASGCFEDEDSVTVHVIDVTCGDSLDKVLICHVPPGNPDNTHTICISPNAVKAHLKNHNDYLGPCTDTSSTDSLNFQPAFSSVFLTSYPNPFSQSTILSFSIPEPDNVKLDVISFNGLESLRLFEGNVDGNTLYTVEFDAGNNSSGVYFYRLSTSTGTHVKKLVVIK